MKLLGDDGNKASVKNGCSMVGMYCAINKNLLKGYILNSQTKSVKNGCSMVGMYCAINKNLLKGYILNSQTKFGNNFIIDVYYIRV